MLRLLATLVLLTIAAPVHADDGRAPIHVQIVLDSSGSMNDNDPGRLSSLAGMIFSDLAGPDDSIGILSMQKGKFVTEPIGKVADRRTRVRSQVKSLDFLGSTYCAEPLEAAAQGLETLRQTEPDGRQFVVFLSDGACPEAASDAVREAARGLADAGVRVFSIGLFGEQGGGPDPTADLRAMASITNGEFFSAQTAADLPQRFASILGRIVGSEAQKLTVESGADFAVTLDGYVYDASLILTGTNSPVVIDAATGPADTKLELPRRAPHALTAQTFHIAAFDNGQNGRYSVLRIEEPAAGSWTFRARGPPDLEALVIQNYALDPVLSLGADKTVYAVGEKCEVEAWLRGKGGEKLADASFLERVEFTATVADPTGKEVMLVLKPGTDGAYVGTHEVATPGEWTLRGRARMKNGGLDKRTPVTKFAVREPTLACAPNHGPLDFGEVRAGSKTKPLAIDLSASDFPAPIEVSLESNIPGLRLDPSKLSLGPTRKTGAVTFTIETDHAGGPVAGQLSVRMGEASVSIPVHGTVIPLSFWEKWGRLILTVGGALLALIVLLFVLYGFTSPHRFPADARLNWGESLERLKKNEILIKEIPRTTAGFYKNAKLVVGGPGSFLPADGAVLAEIEATGSSQITIRSPHVELRQVNKFDETKTTAVDGNEASMHSGEIYQVGKIYLRLR